MNREALGLHLAGVIAGTPFDTAMGSSLLADMGWHPFAFASASGPAEQSEMQNRRPQALQARCLEAMQRMETQGAQFIVIYCSSLSSTFDMSLVKQAVGIPVLSPLDAYRALGREFDRFAVLAANGAGLMGAERTLQQVRPETRVLGLACIDLVSHVERVPLEQAADHPLLPAFVQMAENNACQALLLACTHFSGLAPALQACTSLPVLTIDQHLRPLIEQQVRSVA